MTSRNPIRELEALVYARQHEKAMARLFEILDGLQLTTRGEALFTGEEENEERLLERINRLAAAITSLFVDPSFSMTVRDYARLAQLRRMLTGIFYLSGLGSTDHLLRLIGEPTSDANGVVRFRDRVQALKFLSCYSLHSRVPMDWRALFERNPEVLLLAYLSLLASPPFVCAGAWAAWQQLLASGEMTSRARLTNEGLPLLAIAWMLCSYNERDNKHEIKNHLNHLLRGWLRLCNIPDRELPPQRERKERPTILVVGERLRSTHAVFRCYAPFLRQLRTRFRLELVTDNRYVDEASATLFDNVMTWQVGEPPSEIVARVASQQPDMVYYPSLGMHYLALPLANLRLAPIQFATMGHPATTCSPSMDYMVLSHSVLGDAACFTEKLVVLQSPANAYEDFPRAVNVPPKVRANPDPLRVGIVNKVMKLNASYMSLCQRLAQKCRRALEFHFFPGVGGLQFQVCRRQILEWLPRAIVHPEMEFESYLAQVNEMDVRLGAFPFGGTVTTIDSLRQGIPTVAREGTEPHARLDAMIMRLVGMPDWLIARSEEEFEAAALRLIENDEERVALAHQILQTNVDRILFEEQQQKYPTDFVDAVWWMYQNHESIQRDNRKVWTTADRAALTVA